MDNPIEALTPTKPPDTAAEAAATTALMVEESVAMTETSPSEGAEEVAVTSLSVMWAMVWLRITLVATAPAPLMPIPTRPPPTATEAAMARLSMVEVLVADRCSEPVTSPSVTPSTAAVTALSMVFWATEMPIDTAMAAVPAKAAAREAPRVSARIAEASRAVRVVAVAEIPRRVWPFGASPVIVAATSTRMPFRATAPAPLAPMPTVPPPATAAEAAMTMALMVWAEVAVRLRVVAASTELFRR